VSTQSAAASSAPAAPGGTVIVTKGTKFIGKLGQEISSKKSHDGDTFTLSQADTVFYRIPNLHGALIDGHLENVHPAAVGKNPAMTIVFDDIHMPDGSKVPINVKIDNLGAFDAKSHHWRTLGLMLGGAIAGHMAAGQHHGGLLGAAGGYIVSQQMKNDIDVKPGTQIEVRFLSDAVEPAPAPSGT